MVARSHSASAIAPRLTLRRVLLMLVAALAIFGAAYTVAGLFGRAADDKAGDADARTVAALQPSGTPLLTITARNVGFDTRTIAIPAGQPVQIRVANEDAGILHNIAVYRDQRASELIARGALFDGPRTRDYRFEAISAGTYYFQCDLHPAMNGTFTAE